jgi:hypothetical protein
VIMPMTLGRRHQYSLGPSQNFGVLSRHSACDSKGEANACSNKPENEAIPPRLSDLPVHYRVDSVFGSDREQSVKMS